jgi:hypothetical protein
MRYLSSHLNGHYPIERDSDETDGVLAAKIVRRKTHENLARVAVINGWREGAPRYGWVDATSQSFADRAERLPSTI